MLSAAPFQQWLSLVYQFTMASLKQWKICPNSKHYLLQLWSTLVGPVLVMKDRVPSGVEQCVVDVTKLYIRSR